MPVIAQNSKSGAEKASSKQPTASEMRDWYTKHKNALDRYTAAKNPLTLKDATKSAPKLVTAFNKDSLRNYFQNIGSNEKNLRNLSRYLYYRCQAYYRLVMYNATMFDLNARQVIPDYDITKKSNQSKILKSMYQTSKMVDELNLQYEFAKLLVRAFREDVSFGCTYYTEGEGMFILPLDPDYCRISGATGYGNFTFHMDMSYFRNRAYELEAWGEPFTSMYRAFDNGGDKYQPMPIEYGVCLKARPEDWDLCVPVFSGLLSGIINLIDLDDITAIENEQDIYKMIWLELETIANSDEIDDWKVNPEIVVEYFNRMINEAMPDYITAAMVPGKLNEISFPDNRATDTTKIAKTTETLFNSSGGAQVLNSATISGTTAFTAAIQADTEIAISMLLPQISAWVNMFVHTKLGNNAARVKFFEVSVYTKDILRKQLLDSADRGLPVRLTLNTFNQFSEADTLALQYLEVDCLGLDEVLIPVHTAHTQSGKTDAGAPTKDAGDLTDDGEASRDKVDKAN